MLPPRSRRCGSAARTARTVLSRLKSSIADQSSSSRWSNENRGIVTPGGGPPALLTRTSRPPNRVDRRGHRQAPGPSGVGQVGRRRGRASGRAPRPARATRSARPRRPALPRRAGSGAVARPIPCDAPVTTAIRVVELEIHVSTMAAPAAPASGGNRSTACGRESDSASCLDPLGYSYPHEHEPAPHEVDRAVDQGHRRPGPQAQEGPRRPRPGRVRRRRHHRRRHLRADRHGGSVELRSRPWR